jgi:hypothetical protein
MNCACPPFRRERAERLVRISKLLLPLVAQPAEVGAVSLCIAGWTSSKLTFRNYRCWRPARDTA